MSSKPLTHMDSSSASDSERAHTIDNPRDYALQASLSLAEQKSLLVSKEFDQMGMGRYQWCLWLLCGFGYFLDLTWAQAFGLIIAPIQQELNVPTARIGDLSSAFSAGLTVGAIMWGILVDVIGRRWAFNITCLVSSVFGLIFGAPSNFRGLCAIAAFIGIGIGGNIPIDTTITLEFLPTNRRYLLALLSTFQPIGVVICSAIAYGLVPKYSCAPSLESCQIASAPCCGWQENKGWRLLMFTLGAMTLAVFFARFFLFKFYESPRYLISRGRDDEAIQVVHKVAKFNKQTCTLTEQDFLDVRARIDVEGLEESTGGKQNNVFYVTKVATQRYLGHLKGLVSTKLIARITIITWVVYIFDYWGFSLAGLLPKILNAKGVETSTSVFITYRNYIIIYVCGVPGTIIAAALVEVPLVGRKWAMVVSSALMATCFFLYAAVHSLELNVAFNALEYFFQSMFNAVLYAWTPEVFPSRFRGSACGIASMWGRLFSIIAPIIGAKLLAENHTDGVLYLAGGGTFVATVALILLPFDPRGKQIV